MMNFYKIFCVALILTLGSFNASAQWCGYVNPTSILAGCPYSLYLNQFSINTLTHTLGYYPTGCPPTAYNFYGYTTTLNTGATYSPTFWANTTNNQKAQLWIDFNNDYDFLDAGEASAIAANIPTYGSSSVSFTIPNTATSDVRRMRVVSDFWGSGWTLATCGTATYYGYIYDYNVTIAGCGTPPTFVTTLPSTSTANRLCDNSGKKLLTITSPSGYTATWSSTTNGVITTSNGNYYFNPGAISIDPATGFGQATVTLAAYNGTCTFYVNYIVYVKCCGIDVAQVLGAGNDGKVDYYTLSFNCKNTSYTYQLTGGGPVTFTKVNKVLMANHNCNNYSVRITGCGCPKNFNGGTSCKDDGSIANASLSCYPNPVDEHTTVSFTTATGGTIETGIYNINGQQVMSVFNGSLAAGETVNMPLTIDLPAGIYFVRMVSDSGENMVQKIMVN